MLNNYLSLKQQQFALKVCHLCIRSRRFIDSPKESDEAVT